MVQNVAAVRYAIPRAESQELLDRCWCEVDGGFPFCEEVEEYFWSFLL